jgi:hypothetical protein
VTIAEKPLMERNYKTSLSENREINDSHARRGSHAGGKEENGS